MIHTVETKNKTMYIEKIKTKNWLWKKGTGCMTIGKKIIIYTFEKQELTIEEESKILNFLKQLRT